MENNTYISDLRRGEIGQKSSFGVETYSWKSHQYEDQLTLQGLEAKGIFIQTKEKDIIN